MTESPFLTEPDVRLEVERIFRKDHRSRLLALYGRGQPGQFELDGQTWDIVPVKCELDLRAQLPLPGDASSRGSVFLVDWVEDELPLDVRCRFAGARIFHVASDARLAVLLGARQVEPGLPATALAKLVLSGEAGGLRKVSGILLTRTDLWQRFLEARFQVPESATESASAWLKWARQSAKGPAFLKSCETNALLNAVRRELLDWVTDKLGPIGVLGWCAWERGLVSRALQGLVLLRATEEHGDSYVRGIINGLLAAWMPGLETEMRAAHLAVPDSSLLSSVLDPEGNPEDYRLLQDAESLANAAEVGGVCAASEWLPAGHVAREEALGRRFSAFVDSPSAESLTAVLATLDHLSSHQLDRVVRRSEHVDTRRMAARLCAWLLGRRVRPPLAVYGSTWQPAADLARRYAEEGGYLDWARQAVRGLRGATEPIESAVRSVLAAIDAEAREDDHRFAEAYVSWVNAGKPSSEVLPIEHVTKRIAAPFLKGGEHRRLLLVLMDGMSYSVAVQLLHRLRDQRRWSPIAWRVPGWSGQLPIPPVLAVAPTLTEISRAALFAGTADPRFGDQSTDRDDARWSTNSHIRDLVGEEPLKVFFRKDIHAGHELVPEVKQAIASEQRIVAVVVNAVDEQLKGSLQVAVDYSRTPILPLEALLSAADGAERAVLLVADHGHVSGDNLHVVGGRLQSGREGGARWRALAEGEHPSADEVLLPQCFWKPRGAVAVATVWNTQVSNRAPSYGEHGGLSLSEVVVPAFLIGPEWLDQVSGSDVELSCRTLPEPDWWALKVARPVAVLAEILSPVPAPAPTAAQLSLPSVGAPTKRASVPPPVAIAESPTISLLRRSSLFTQHVAGVTKLELERVLTWLGVLLDAGGTLVSTDFARMCGVRPHQVGGVVARMGILNADGFAIVEHDIAGRRVVLHRARLLQQFGVSE